MQTHDLDPSLIPGGRRRVIPRHDEAGPNVSRALAGHVSEALGPRGVLHLQRTAGNASVSRLLEDDSPSPVLGVVGRGGGRTMEPDVRGLMESRLGADFGDVRIHTDDSASESARAINAQAYTVGSDVVFQSGRYQPTTPVGQRTLAHELTHVLQQRSGAVDGTPAAGGILISDPSDRFEQAAESNAERVMSAASAAAAPVAAPAAQREEDTVQELPVQALVAQREGEEEEEESAG